MQSQAWAWERWNLIDDKDINFSQLKVWQDINGDGISQTNELKTLDELGITSINLKATSTFIQNSFIKFIQNNRFYKADFSNLRKIV